MMGKQEELMEAILVAPCGMNCGICSAYLAGKYDLKKQGVNKGYCAGCRPRGKNCALLKRSCELLVKGKIQFCYECADSPCKRLKGLDRRYRKNYHMSMIENLDFIKEQGMTKFLKKETEKWKCLECGGTICCHDGICYSCGVAKLKELIAKRRKTND
jgi:hypothetical protein